MPARERKKERKKEMKNMKNKKLYTMTECAMMIALATVLSMCKLYQAPLGGSVTLLSMLPIIFISVRHGLVWGLGSGFVYSLIQMLLGLGNLTYIPTPLGVFGGVMLDYVLPFTLLGLGGVFMLMKPKSKKTACVAIVCGAVLVVVLRFLCHFLSGAVVWYEITKTGEWNDYVKTVGMWTYSFVYNITYLGPDGALVIIASPVLVRLREMPFVGGKGK